jgi:acetyl esterase/lipase
MIRATRALQGFLLLALAPLAAPAAEAPVGHKDLGYANVAGTTLGLDLYLPAGVKHAPLVVYLHGGAWNAGNKSQYPAFLVERGFAVASLDFRSTDVAPFPANIHDIKAAIRYLRAKATDYGYRADRIAIGGASSGGHLAALVGVTNGESALEGDEGEHRDQSSAVQAIISWFGGSDLTTILSQSTPFGLSVREPALRRLLGAAPDAVPELAKQASPVFHVDAKDPPLFLLHGDQDRQMPINQLHELDAAYSRAGLKAEALILDGVGHDAEPFFRGAPVDRVVDFLHRTIGH